MTTVETVWAQMKWTAEKCARDGKRVSVKDAQDTIIRLLHRHRVTPCPPQPTLDFLTREFLDMVQRSR